MARNRLIGDYPVIGIRPTIDGRRGEVKVRESLEDQTMDMARAAAELLQSNLRYSNGEPVKVVIADTTIGRVAAKYTGREVVAGPGEATAIGNLIVQMIAAKEFTTLEEGRKCI